ncbi:MAG: molybdenum cofactor biosynthesis protein MoaE [Alphaproteobacteria bacterium]
MITVKIQKEKFNPQNILIDAEKEKKYGALVSFIGSVREEANNGKVKKLFIEHYKNMAEKIIYKTALNAEKKWNLDYCYVIHRYGTLKAGESIVMVITASKHRKEAYTANQYIIDWLKINAPFWKKEIFENESKWVEQTL